MEQIKDRIINCLRTTKVPQGVENIRVACNIGNWNTALKHCLELVLQEKINGQKKSKSWIFWINPSTCKANNKN
ncbi:MAG: hypothetical protein NUK62_08245 [Tenericutes bacterium]|nr:hypothetical protein [Mycoplasmatota bacterium]